MYFVSRALRQGNQRTVNATLISKMATAERLHETHSPPHFAYPSVQEEHIELELRYPSLQTVDEAPTSAALTSTPESAACPPREFVSTWKEPPRHLCGLHLLKTGGHASRVRAKSF